MKPREINLSDAKWLPGEKRVVKGLRAAASSDSAVVTYSMLEILGEGGNAIDAAIAACLLQAVTEPFMTNLTGTISMLYYNVREDKYYQLDSSGTIPYDLPPHMPVPPGMGEYSDLPPRSCIPGFTRGIKEMYSRFASMSWERLCREALWWSERGHHVSDFEASINVKTQRFITYFPEGRRFYMPGGRMPTVGSLFKNDSLRKTVLAIMEQGPDYMINGAWAESFIKKANDMGFMIEKRHMTQTPPVWQEPVRFSFGEYEVLSLAPPMQQGVFLSMVLGILDALDLRRETPYGAKHLFFMTHALRLGMYFCGFFNDPGVLGDITTLLSRGFHEHLASLIRGMIPKVNLTSHMMFTSGNHKDYDYDGFGSNLPSPLGDDSTTRQPSGSCELSIVDEEGNWVQMMNTLQSGGIPGMVVEGVPMVGSHAVPNDYEKPMAYYHTEGARARLCLGNTILLKDGRPVFGLGTPGNCFCTVPQVLANYVFFDMDPYDAIRAPRMLPLQSGAVMLIEDRIPLSVQQELLAMGVESRVSVPWDMHMGSFQSCFVDKKTGELCATADPRRCGVGDGIR